MSNINTYSNVEEYLDDYEGFINEFNELFDNSDQSVVVYRHLFMGIRGINKRIGTSWSISERTDHNGYDDYERRLLLKGSFIKSCIDLDKTAFLYNGGKIDDIEMGKEAKPYKLYCFKEREWVELDVSEYKTF